MRSVYDVAYRPGGERGLLDVITPEGLGPWPVIVAVHGGGWKQGAKEGYRDLAPYWTGLGYAVVAPTYRFITTDPHPAQEQDILAVLDWVADHAAKHHFDPQRIALTGSSAGGHLVALVGIKATRVSSPRYTIRCLIPICGVHDVARWGLDRPNYLDSHIRLLLAGLPEDRHAAARDSSPIHHVHPAAPPCLLVHGEADEVVPVNQSQLLAEALRGVGATVELITIPGQPHSVRMPDGTPVLTSAQVRRFVEAHL